MSAASSREIPEQDPEQNPSQRLVPETNDDENDFEPEDDPPVPTATDSKAKSLAYQHFKVSPNGETFTCTIGSCK